MDGNTPLQFTLSLDMTKVVLSSLGAQPYEKAAGIIASIQQQASSQLQPAPQADPADPAAAE